MMSDLENEPTGSTQIDNAKRPFKSLHDFFSKYPDADILQNKNIQLSDEVESMQRSIEHKPPKSLYDSFAKYPNADILQKKSSVISCNE